MPAGRPRCTAIAEASREPMMGTASSGAAWILLEDWGPWGARTPTDSRLPAPLTEALGRRAAAAGVKVLLGRRAGERPADGRRTCLLAHAGPAAPFLEEAILDDAAEVLEVDLERLGRGERPHFGRSDHVRRFMTCTNAKRDPCCAVRGRPVARALHRALGDRAWQVTHLGGHRFAANVLVLPDGFLFGRLDPETAVRTALEIDRGRLPLDRLRGRSGLAARAQAAELLLRRRLGLERIDDLTLLEQQPAGAAFMAGDRRHDVRVRETPLPPRPTSCAGEGVERPVAFDLVEVSRA